MGILAPTAWNLAGSARNSLISWSSSTASSTPATSAKVIFGASLLTILARDLPKLITRLPPPWAWLIRNQNRPRMMMIGKIETSRDDSQPGFGLESSKPPGSWFAFAAALTVSTTCSPRGVTQNACTRVASLTPSPVNFWPSLRVMSIRWSPSTILTLSALPSEIRVSAELVSMRWKDWPREPSRSTDSPISTMRTTHTSGPRRMRLTSMVSGSKTPSSCSIDSC